MSASLYGSDVIVELLRRLGIEYAALNPGATFRGIHDSLVNFPSAAMKGTGEGGLGPAPEIIQCLHEEISVALAHGYAKAAGRPMAAFVHNIVGLQHASMAVFNAWCDRAPILLMGGTGPMDLTRRRPWIDWIHTALVQGSLVRDYVKWDDQPAGLASVPESLLRAYRVAQTDPPGPVYVCFDADLQEDPVDEMPQLPDPNRYLPPEPPVPSDEQLEGLAARLIEAEFPVIVAEYVGREPEAVAALTELAELLGAPVLDHGSRFNFPTTHPMDFTGGAGEILPEADLILALDAPDLFRALSVQDKATRESGLRLSPGCRVAQISNFDLSIRSWSTDYHRLPPVDMPLAGSAARSLPALVRNVRGRLEKDAGRRKAALDRFGKLEARQKKLRAGWETEARQSWDSKPISTARLAGELWNLLKDEDWVLTNGKLSGWERKLWEWKSPHQYVGDSGGAGLGYGMGASIGVALAHRGSGRLCVNLQADGDFLYTPSALWTAVHHEVPLLTVLVNNRTYYNSEEHALAVAANRDRPTSRAGIGTRIEEPAVGFVQLAESYGMAAFGPVEDPAELAPVLKRAVQIVQKEKRPALVDVVTQVR
jgi:thiamine pyrophosphate-dependent acetolactate synthase large subunit-like protein